MTSNSPSKKPVSNCNRSPAAAAFSPSFLLLRLRLLHPQHQHLVLATVASTVGLDPFTSSHCSSHPSPSSSFIAWNCHSLNDDHLSELAVVAGTQLPLFIALCETRRAPSNCRLPKPRLHGYNWYGFDSAENSGGVGLFLHDSLAATFCSDLSSKHPPSSLPANAPLPPPVSAQAVFVRVVIPSLGREIMVGSCYCQPKDSGQWDALLAAIRVALSAARSTDTPVMLLGDFNARHSITGERCKDSHRGKSLAAFLEEQDLHLLNSSLCHGQATFPALFLHSRSGTRHRSFARLPLAPQPALLLHSDHYPMLGRFASQQEIQSVPPLLLPSNQRQGKSSSLSSPKLAFDRMDIKTFRSLLEPLCTSWLADRNNQQQLDSDHTLHPATALSSDRITHSITVDLLSRCSNSMCPSSAPRTACHQSLVVGNSRCASSVGQLPPLLPPLPQGQDRPGSPR